MRKNPIRKTTIDQPLVLLWLLILLTCLSGCGAERGPFVKSGFALNTAVTVTLYHSDEKALLDPCLALCSDYEALFNKTIASSDISRINHAGGEWVTVSPDTIALLQQALYYSELSDGCFDVTIASVDSLWDFTSVNAAKTPPDERSVHKALSHVNYKNIMISGNQVMLNDPEASIDLGGIAKGYIADRMKEYLTEHGVRSGIIDLGGNILLIGTKPDQSTYHIGIRRPFPSEDETDTITSIDVSDTSVVTSGIYERCFTYEERLYHHILSPSTGYPVDGDLNSVTIISDSSASCDALSTACMLLGLTDGMELIESLPDTEAIFITKQNEIYTTSGMSNKLSQ